jgi:hypothetical protein
MEDNSKACMSNEEIQRRKALVEHISRMRDELSSLDMTTAELVRLAREERKWLYGSYLWIGDLEAKL